jgi:hypothetical protein
VVEAAGAVEAAQTQRKLSVWDAKEEETDVTAVSKIRSSSMMLISARPNNDIGTNIGVPDQTSHIP